MPVYGGAIRWRDARGMTMWNRLYINRVDSLTANSQFGILAVNISTGTNAALQGGGGVYATAPTTVTYGASAAFRDIQDRCRLYMRTAAGTILTFDIPAPKRTIFQADAETGILTSGAIKTVADRLVSGLFCTRDGIPYAELVFAKRVRVNMHRQRGIYLKNPALTGPD